MHFSANPDQAVVRLACDCAATPPTMPTCRDHHLDWCTSVTGVPAYAEHGVPAGQSRATGGVVDPRRWRVVSADPGDCDLVLPVVTDPERRSLLDDLAQLLAKYDGSTS